MKKLVVIAFGGNALLLSDQVGTIEEEEKNAYDAACKVFKLVKKGYDLVLTHGNGPQVGNILLSDAAGSRVYGFPSMPLDVLVAYSQGFIGYILEKEFRNVFMQKGVDKDILSIITQVVVDENDSAFKNPTKPIGPYYSKEAAEKFSKEEGDKYVKDPKGRGWRKVVPSPKPIGILNVDTVEKMARNGKVVIAVGGGGIPVYYKKKDRIQGMEAVIDKDLASSLLASHIKADELYFLTDISKVFLNFNTPQQKAVDKMTVAEAKKYLEEGHFAPGSMAPKIIGGIEFVEKTNGTAIITSPSEMGNENAGTRIIA